MATSYGIEPYLQGFGGPHAPSQPEVAEKLIDTAPACGCLHRPSFCDAPFCEPFRSRVFRGLCGWARTSGLRLPKPAVYQLTLHTDWNPLSWGWRGLRPQRVASVAGAGNVSLVLHGVAHRCHLRCNIPHILQASVTWTSAPERRLKIVGVGAQSRTGVAGFAILCMAVLPRPH